MADDSDIFFISFCTWWIFSLNVFALFSTVLFKAKLPELCREFIDSRSLEIFLTLSSIPTNLPSKLPMFSLRVSTWLDISLSFLPTCCLDLLGLDRMLESLWQSSDSDEELVEGCSSIFLLIGSFISFGGSSSSLLSSDAELNSEMLCSFTLS